MHQWQENGVGKGILDIYTFSQISNVQFTQQSDVKCYIIHLVLVNLVLTFHIIFLHRLCIICLTKRRPIYFTHATP